MRYRTAANLSLVLIGGMFALPAAVKDLLLPSLEQGVVIPFYERALLGVSIFCLSFRYLLVLPIVLVLFAVALFTNERVAKNQFAAAAPTMKRPTGVTVIAVLNIILAGVVIIASGVLPSAHRPQGVMLGILVTAALFWAGLGVALLKLQNWARVLVILFTGLSLIGIPVGLVMAHSLGDAMEPLVRGLYFLWIVCYLLQPQIKAAFGKHS